jgi:hypothetical protein
MTDPADQPEGDGYDLVVPFVACVSQGGPYDDVAFVAGFQAGMVDRALHVAQRCGARVLTFTGVYSTLLRQVELLAMHRGFPVMESTIDDDRGEWATVTFRTSAAAGESAHSTRW